MYSVKYEGQLPENFALSVFDVVSAIGNEIIFKTNNQHSSNELLKGLLNQNVNIIQYNEILPTLNEIFIKQVESNNA